MNNISFFIREKKNKNQKWPQRFTVHRNNNNTDDVFYNVLFMFQHNNIFNKSMIASIFIHNIFIHHDIGPINGR